MMATQPPPEAPQPPAQPVHPDAPPPEIAPIGPDFDQPAPGTSPGAPQPTEI
jgi:hypothetical protein